MPPDERDPGSAAKIGTRKLGDGGCAGIPGSWIGCADDGRGIGKILRIAPAGRFDSGKLIVDFIPGVEIDDSRLGESEPLLGCEDCLPGGWPEDPVRADSGNFRNVLRQNPQHILQMFHFDTPVALLNGIGDRPGILIVFLPLTSQFRHAGDSDVITDQGIPGSLPNDSVHLQIENMLEFSHSGLCLGSENAIHR